MQIANPIYDVVFKYLLQNNELAILILSTILEEKIMALVFCPRKLPWRWRTACSLCIG